MILMAFIVVAVVTAISLLILARDLLVWFARRFRNTPKAIPRLPDDEPRDKKEGDG
jgi:hypothetical protein